MSEIFLFVLHFAIVFSSLAVYTGRLNGYWQPLHQLDSICLLHCHHLLSIYLTECLHGLWFDRQKGNELCQNGRVMKGLLFTCYHGNHNVQSLIYDGLSVRQSTFNHLGEEYCRDVDLVIHLYSVPISHLHLIFCETAVMQNAKAPVL